VGIKRDACDAAFSDAIRMRNNFTCEKCELVDTNGQMTGKSRVMETAHVYGRRDRSLRWHTDNAVCLCSSCHRKFTESPLDFASFIENEVLGEGRTEMLRERRNAQIKYNKKQKEEIKKHYKAECRRLQKLRDAGETGYIEVIAYD
jgi:hypothetical protein|tara:strand:- start:6188 stop:6625 length:438 start_codon:yes stop_codon:yes gene_type:complete